MQAKLIVFPTDFSEHSEAALRQATSLARDSGAVLLILHVKEPPDTFVDTGFGGYPVVENEEELRRLLDEVAPPDPNVRYTHRLVTGHPAEEIVRVANEENADMIVIGTHGRTGLTRLLMGSIAEAVVRHASCPVLCVKQPAKSRADSATS